MNDEARIPSWLTKGLAEAAAAPLAMPAQTGSPVVGELWLAAHMSEPSPRRIVLIVEEDPATGILTVALLTNVVEAATDRDVIVQPKQSALSFTTVVQADVMAPIWREQLIGRMGAIPQEWAEAVAATGNSNFVALPPELRGLPMQSEGDWRPSFKRDELHTMQVLSADCVGYLLEPERAVVCDPRFLRPDVANDSDCEALFILAAGRTAQIGGAATWSLIQQPGYQDAWVRRFGWDGWSAVQTLLRPGESASGVDMDLGVVSVVPPRSDPTDAKLIGTEALGVIAAGRHSMVLATRAEHWLDKPKGPIEACSVHAGGERVHVIRELLEV